MPIRKLSRALGWTLLLGAAAPPPARVGPTYDSADTRALVEAMVEAHGGMDAWRAAAVDTLAAVS
ncbi:MAG: hypothetical protein ABFS34_10950 [Gemmatimonadota bacterium]